MSGEPGRSGGRWRESAGCQGSEGGGLLLFAVGQPTTRGFTVEVRVDHRILQMHGASGESSATARSAARRAGWPSAARIPPAPPMEIRLGGTPRQLTSGHGCRAAPQSPPSPGHQTVGGSKVTQVGGGPGKPDVTHRDRGQIPLWWPDGTRVEVTQQRTVPTRDDVCPDARHREARLLRTRTAAR